MKTVAVLPCPFCCTSPVAERYDGGLFIGCETESCPVQPSVWDFKEDQVVVDWNTRAAYRETLTTRRVTIKEKTNG